MDRLGAVSVHYGFVPLSLLGNMVMRTEQETRGPKGPEPLT